MAYFAYFYRGGLLINLSEFNNLSYLLLFDLTRSGIIGLMYLFLFFTVLEGSPFS